MHVGFRPQGFDPMVMVTSMLISAGQGRVLGCILRYRRLHSVPSTRGRRGSPQVASRNLPLLVSHTVHYCSIHGQGGSIQSTRANGLFKTEDARVQGSLLGRLWLAVGLLYCRSCSPQCVDCASIHIVSLCGGSMAVSHIYYHHAPG
jgi:hypothetical protein